MRSNAFPGGPGRNRSSCPEAESPDSACLSSVPGKTFDHSPLPHSASRHGCSLHLAGPDQDGSSFAAWEVEPTMFSEDPGDLRSPMFANNFYIPDLEFALNNDFHVRL